MRTLAIVALGALAFSGSATANSGEPTCSEFGIAVYGEHAIGDYVTDIGGGVFGDGLGWPPDGSEVGAWLHEHGGPHILGGHGPGFHFEHGFAPGASACTDSESPGIHL